MRCKATAIDTASYSVWPNLYPVAGAIMQVEQSTADPLAISIRWGPLRTTVSRAGARRHWGAPQARPQLSVASGRHDTQAAG